MKQQSQRQLRVSEKFRHALSELLQRNDFGDPELEGVNLMTVSEVRMSPDLKNATVYVSCLDNSKEKRLIDALNEVAPQIKGQLGRKAELRFTPRVYFVSDTSFDYARNIDALMHDEQFQRDVNAPDHDEDDT